MNQALAQQKQLERLVFNYLTGGSVSCMDREAQIEIQGHIQEIIEIAEKSESRLQGIDGDKGE